MKKWIVVLGLFFSTMSYAGIPEMMKVYKNPHSAPPVTKCKQNAYCNAFVALSKQWKDIPNSYRYNGFDIKSDARNGDGYGLNKGFSLHKNQSIAIAESGDEVFYAGGGKGAANERVFAQGLAVLLYLEGIHGWNK